MRPRNTVVLLAILAALGAYLYWVELPREARQAEEKRLLAVEQEKVTSVTLAYPERTIALAKGEDGHWRLREPLDAPADDAVVGNLIRAVATAEVTRTLEDVGDKLASYGLAPAEAVVTLGLDDGTTAPPIKVGTTTSVGFSSYVQKGDAPEVLITTAAFRDGMKKEVKDLRDKSVIAFEDQEVQELALARPATPVTIERRDGENWRITAPGDWPADAAEVRALLASLRGIRATDFVTDDPVADLGAYGLGTPRLSVRVAVGEDRARKTLHFGGAHEDEQKRAVYAKREEQPTVYLVPEYALKNLDKEVATLRDKTVVAFDRKRAARIVVTRADGDEVVLVKRDDAWHLETPGEGTERTPTITRYVDDVATMKGATIAAEGTIERSRFGLDAPDLRITVEDAQGTPLATLLGARGTASDAEAESYLAAEDGTVVYGVKPFAYDRLDKRASDFRETPPSPAPPGTPAADAAPLGEEDLGGGLELEAPPAD